MEQELLTAKDGTQTPEAREQKFNLQGGLVGKAFNVLRLVAFAAFTFSFVQQATYGARHKPRDLAFLLLAHSMLALLFWCIKKFEQLTPESYPVESRERLKFSVWLLSTALSFAFAWRVAEIMPFMLKVVVWAMTSLVMLVGFYGLFLYKEEEYCKRQNCQ